MPRGLHHGNVRKIIASKEALHPLPVVKDGVTAVYVASVEVVMVAARKWAKDNGGTIAVERKARSAGVWIAHKCTEFSGCAIARMLQRSEGAVNREMSKVDANLRLGVGNDVVEGVLRILRARGHAVPAENAKRTPIHVPPPKRPGPKVVEEPTPAASEATMTVDYSDPRWIEARRLRQLKWSYTGISKRTGLPPNDVARFCGVELERRA